MLAQIWTQINHNNERYGDKMDYKFKISIIIPIYNSESYLDDVFTSLVNQTIGFENMQVILVNDGSKDKSEEICIKYRDMYKNVVYILKENGGVSSARNEGLKYVEGKYINFIDSDDKWSENALLNMYDFMEENYTEIDFISGRVKNFEANQDYHYLDYKFEKTKVIDIEKEPDMLIFHVASSLFKTEKIKEMKFDVNLKIGEDCLFINTLLLNNLKYGVCREAVYNYRKRITANSAMQNISRSRDWYFETPKYLWKKLQEESIKKYNKIIKYIQYVLLYELKFRINCQYTILNCIEIQEHLEIMKANIKFIDDEVIQNYRLLNSNEKDILMKLKK